MKGFPLALLVIGWLAQQAGACNGSRLQISVRIRKHNETLKQEEQEKSWKEEGKNWTMVEESKQGFKKSLLEPSSMRKKKSYG